MGNTGLQAKRVECWLNKLLNNNTEITVGVDPRRVRVFLLKGTSKCLGQVVTRGKCLGQVMTRDMFLDQWHGLWKHYIFEGDPYCIPMFERTLPFLRESTLFPPIVFLCFIEPFFFWEKNIVFLKGTPYCTPRFERTLRLWEKNTVFLKGTPYCTPRFERTLLFVREEYNLFEGDPLLYS